MDGICEAISKAKVYAQILIEREQRFEELSSLILSFMSHWYAHDAESCCRLIVE
jgi:hypothetical protein